MNYVQVLELQDAHGNETGLYHMTTTNNGRTRATGYCWEDENGKRCPGHPTKDEAAEHYWRYKLDKQLRFGNDLDAQHKCAECGKWTTGFAECDLHMVDLCDEHKTREIVEKHYPKYKGSYYAMHS